MTIAEFVEILMAKYMKKQMISKQDALYIGKIISVGLLPLDVIDKRSAARILHFFLRQTKIEEDEPNWDGAKILKDLYDCHSCVDHVGQIYVKGIIEPREHDIFGMRDVIEEDEANKIVARVFDRTKRSIPQNIDR